MPRISMKYRCIEVYRLSVSIIDLVELRANFLPCFSLRSTTRQRHPVGKGRSENSEIEALVTVLLVKELPPAAHTSYLLRSKLSLPRVTFSRRDPHRGVILGSPMRVDSGVPSQFLEICRSKGCFLIFPQDWPRTPQALWGSPAASKTKPSDCQKLISLMPFYITWSLWCFLNPGFGRWINEENNYSSWIILIYLSGFSQTITFKVEIPITFLRWRFLTAHIEPRISATSVPSLSPWSTKHWPICIFCSVTTLPLMW